MSSSVYGVLLAGGSGSRFWPLSTKDQPKQFLSLVSEQTMIQTTYHRFKGMIKPENWIVVTNAAYVDKVAEQLPMLEKNQIIGEPIARNTAPPIALACAMIAAQDPEAVVVVLPSDHHIGNEEEYLDTMQKAIRTAGEKDALVTLGIQPTHPETGYGYISYDRSDSLEENGTGISFRVDAFREKPDRLTAEQFISEGNYLWNSGMFIWKASRFLREISAHMTELYAELAPFLDGEWSDATIHDFFQNTTSVSIDYGLMERSGRVWIVPGDFGWNDVGSWSAVHELADKDGHGNSGSIDRFITINSSNNHIHISKNIISTSDKSKLVALIGVEGLAVVDTGTVLMICPIDQAQEVKKAVEALDDNPNLTSYR